MADPFTKDGEGYTREVVWRGYDANLKPEVVEVLNRAQQLVDFPIVLNSGYRDPARNARAGGAKRSQHMLGKAADVSVKGLSNDQRTQLTRALSQSGARRLGAYSGNTALHLDMASGYKPQKGYSAYAMFDRTRHKMGSAPQWFKSGLDGGKIPPLDIRSASAPESIPAMPEGLRDSRMAFAGEGASGDSPQGDLIDMLERRTESKRSGIVEPGNIDLDARQIVRNEDGSISTEKSFSFEEDGVEVLIPTVFDGSHHSEDEAISHYRKTGEHLGKFTSPEAATTYAHQLHDRQDARYNTSDPVEDGATKGDLLDFLKVRAEAVPTFDRMPEDFPGRFFEGAQNPRPERQRGRPFASGPPVPPQSRNYPPELVAGLTAPEIGADPLADGSWVNLPTDEARKLLEQSMDVRPRPERLSGRPVDPTITMEFDRPGSQPGPVTAVPQGTAAPVPQQTIVATEPRPERLAGRPFMPGPTQPAPVPMPASGAAAARTASAPDRAPVRTAMLPTGKPVEVGRSYQISGETYIGGVDAEGRGTLNKVDAGILKEAGSGTIVGNIVDSEIGKAAAAGFQQVGPAVSSALDTISSGASDVFGNVGDKLGEWFGGSKAEAPATKTIRVRNPAFKSVVAPVPVEQTVMLDRFGIPTGEVGSRGGTPPQPKSRPNVPEFIEITVPSGSAPVPASMSAAARAGRSTSAAPRPASRSFRPVIAPRPATMSADLAARRDTAGSGMGGLVNVIGALLGTNARSPTRAPIPYKQGSGQSYQTATYGSGGSSYGSSPGQMTAGLAPGDRVYNTSTNSWGLKR